MRLDGFDVVVVTLVISSDAEAACSKLNFDPWATAAKCVVAKEGDASMLPWKTMPGLKKMHLIIHLNIIHYPLFFTFADILKL
jgi:hypothetical protein